MTSLESGVQYGLSSQGHFNENKSLIFVKLTDSAQRCIEEYLRNKGKIQQRPTIQFQGNDGQLFFPSSKSADQGRFTFSLSNDQEGEGAQGGFECIQKTGPKEMESLGALLCKMRVHANDDIFETTRHRMQAVEVSNKNKCTRVLKSNETVGKKVKVKGTVRKILPASVPVSSSASPKHRALPQSQPQPQPQPQPSRPPPAKPAFSQQQQPQQQQQQQHQQHQQHQQQRKSPDIMRRSLRERLIHLLALRPFKKIELYDRIQQDGLREQERKLVNTVLKQISHMQGNCYQLHAGAWSDVQDDWPFYTDEERAALKRRKPQNLTPPGSSDASSSGSGQSPNSVRSDSPPRIIASSAAALSAKRQGYERGGGGNTAADGFPQKRQRVSEYRRPAPVEVGFLASFQEHAQVAPAELMDRLREQQREQREQRENQPQNREPSFLDRQEAEDNGAEPPNTDYLQNYTTISSLEQKAQYKADFLAYYEDYRALHLQLSEISQRFVRLEEELRRKRELGDRRAYEEAERQIVQEYSRTRHVKRRFQYLHEKLGYIKQLVADYDAKLMQHFENGDAY